MPQAVAEQRDASYLSRVLPRLIIDHSDWSNGDLLTALQSRDDYPGDGSVRQKTIKNAANRLREKLAKQGFLVDPENPGAKLYPAENLLAAASSSRSSSSPSTVLKCSACERPHPTNRFTCPRCSVGHNRYHVCNIDCQKRFWKKHKAEHDAQDRNGRRRPQEQEQEQKADKPTGEAAAEASSSSTSAATAEASCSSTSAATPPEHEFSCCVLCHKSWPWREECMYYMAHDGARWATVCSEACKEAYRDFEAVDLTLSGYTARWESESASRPSEKVQILGEMKSSEEPYIVAWSMILRGRDAHSLPPREREEMAQQLSAHLENMEARAIRPDLRKEV